MQASQEAAQVEDGLTDATIAEILRTTRRIALVGASAKPERL